ncbi:MAG: DinB family protein [Gemmatimonadales bacterium]
MPKQRSFLSESLDNWRDVRRGLIAEVENIRATKFDYRPVPEVRSVRELVQHILEVAMMMTGELTQPGHHFHGASYAKLLEEHAGAAYDATTKKELLALLESQMNDAAERFEAAGEEAIMQPIRNFDGSYWTRMQWLHHGIQHEMYHRGQLCTYERLMGLTPALTKMIHGG